MAYNEKENLSNKDIVISIMDCKNENCYFAMYEKSDNGFNTLIEPQAESLDGLLSILKAYTQDNLNSPKITFVGDGSKLYWDKIKNIFKDAILANDISHILDSYSLAIAGLDEFNNSYFSGDNLEFLPLYLKKPQAQRQLEERLKNNK